MLGGFYNLGLYFGLYLGAIWGMAVLAVLVAIPSLVIRSIKKKTISLSGNAIKWMIITYALLIIGGLVYSFVGNPSGVTFSFAQAFTTTPADMECGLFSIYFVAVSLIYVSNIFVLTTEVFEYEQKLTKKVARVVCALLVITILMLLIALVDYLTTSMCWNIFVTSFVVLLCGIKLGFEAFDNINKTKRIALKIGVVVLCLAVYILSIVLLSNTLYKLINEVVALFLSILLLVATIYLARWLCQKCCK